MNTQSIKFRLVLWCAGASLLVCLGFGFYTYFGLKYFLYTSETAAMQRRAHQIAALVTEHINQQGETFTAELIKASYAPEHNDRFIVIRRGDGSLLYMSGQPTDDSFDAKTLLSLPIMTDEEQEHRVSLQKNLLMVQASAHVARQKYVITCGTSMLPSLRVQRMFLITLGFWLPLMLIGAVIGGRMLVRRALLPVREIIDASREITSYNLGRRLPVAHTQDELELLSVVLNQMIGRLEDAFQHSRRFTADASHELRTPLTIMRVELENLSRAPGLDPASRTKIASVLEEAERLTGTVESLFAITRLEAGEAMMDVSRFDLSELVTATSEQMSLLAEEKHIAVQTATVERVEVTGDRFRLKQVIVNLLDNAIKYSWEGGEIVLSTRTTAEQAILEVADRGEGIPEAALARVFDRFFRADGVRTHTESGAGLGLSIVRSICHAHGGAVEAENREGGGCRIIVRLPVAIGQPNTGLV